LGQRDKEISDVFKNSLKTAYFFVLHEVAHVCKLAVNEITADLFALDELKKQNFDLRDKIENGC
jgi:hypothetical protein